jgi:ribonucleoside-diphosphate reductase alpha chain
MSFNMNVVKRNGQLEEMMFDKILNRIKNVSIQAKVDVNCQQLAIKVIEQLFDNIKSTKIDELVAEQCTSMSAINPDYGDIASRIIISNHQKNTQHTFSTVTNILYNNNINPVIMQEYWEFVNKYAVEIEEMIDYSRDYLIDYFGFKTLEKAYLLKKDDIIIERPQHMWMRVAVGIHFHFISVSETSVSETSVSETNVNLALIKETYDLMSQKYYTHATPTLYNAGTCCPQLSSCYLLAMEDDSIDGIFNTLKDCAVISKYSGGIGLHISNIRSKGSRINGINGKSNGIVPMLRVFNNTARYADQGGKRSGSFAIYLEPWHPDVFEFLDMRKNHGDDELKGKDLFYALWVPDLFMERVKEVDGQWSMFCPNECPGLSDVYGDDFKDLYKKYEEEGRAKKTVSARSLWFAILDSQMETGNPYLLYKDAVNKKSNQKNVGIIKSSNLCTEIVEYSDKNETAVCNLASIALPAFVNVENQTYDFEGLYKLTKVITNNLNRIIDINFYPTEKTKTSNLRHRPIGIGVQGLADTFVMLNIPFHSQEAKELNKQIFETIYYSALEKSNELAIEHGAYSTFDGSPASQGILQFDLWNVTPSSRYDWEKLKLSICNHGIRNSLLVAPMPTASTSQILGYNECFEPFTSNLYTRRTLAGEFVVVNKYLIKELIKLGYWNETIKNSIILHKGSIQHLTELSEHIRNKYKIVWEIPMKFVIDLAADRGAFICQSQSLNLWMEEPVYNKLTSMHFYAWEKGLKTGIYYLRRKSKHQAQQFTIEVEEKNTNTLDTELDTGFDNVEEDEICEMCSA